MFTLEPNFGWNTESTKKIFGRGGVANLFYLVQAIGCWDDLINTAFFLWVRLLLWEIFVIIYTLYVQKTGWYNYIILELQNTLLHNNCSIA